MAVGSMLRMNTVGPTTNTKTASSRASTMLMLESHWMPLATPETAESTNATVRAAMMPTRTALPTVPMPPTICRPLRICRAPRPSEAAEPKSVAKMASMSITRPPGPWARLPSSGSKAAEISWARPLRNTP